jgi:hypothetical protein
VSAISGAGELPAALRRWDDELFIERGRRSEAKPALLQERDVALITDVWRYKFLTTDQLRALHWPGRSEQATRRRLVRLFEQGYLERLRPRAQMGQGTYQWTYFLGPQGHALLRSIGHLAPRAKYEPKPVFDFAYVIHDIQANGWVIAYRELLGQRLIGWRGEAESQVTPPPGARERNPYLRQKSVGGKWVVEGIDPNWVQPVRPDAVLDFELGPDGGRAQLYVEFDRTGRPDKNAPKFRRYDAFLGWWWRLSEQVAAGGNPLVVFVCPDERALRAMLAYADHALTVHRTFWQAKPSEQRYPARERIIFVAEVWAYDGSPEAWRVPEFLPPGHPDRESSAARRTKLPTELR